MYGDLLLALALFFSLCAMLGYVVAHGKKAVWGKRLTWLSAAFGVAASAYLMVLIFQNRFDIAYVAGYSSAELPTMYKISVFWAGQQGSFLLWLFIHMIAGLILCTRQRLANGGMALYLALQSALVVLVLAKSPFAPAAQAVTNGQGLNPLLQDPWMAVHPPIIFVGYALLAVPLVYALCALLKGEQSLDWLKPARNWLLVAWAFLGAGIFIGGYWAYKVLGWGGFWGWDPVENSSLVPWLLATVLLHVLHVARVRKAALSLVHLAAIFTYAFVLYGTFLTRSGILGDFSVHSFSGSSIGLTIAIVNGLVLMAGLIVLAVRANTLPKGEVYPAYASREFIVLLGMLVTVFITALVFLGMSMPLLTQLVGRPAAVDTAFYVRTTMPLAIVLMLTLACACLRRYGEGNVLSKGRLPAVLLVVGMAAAFAVGVRQVLPIILSGAALGAVGASAISWRQHGLGLGGMIAHAGVGLALMAMVFAGSGSQVDYSGTGFIYPVKGYTYISSYYGWRFNNTNYHTGVDFPAPANTPIRASASGTVIYVRTGAGYGRAWGYGNYVIVDHGGGFSTLYAHCTSIPVSVGDTVTKGQTIAYVGTTGWSTGYHLHFEIRRNGAHTNPLNYL